MTKKLNTQQKHIVRLIFRDRNRNGWAKISDLLYPVINHCMPSELVEFKKAESGGHARLTELGYCIHKAMEWL